MKISVNKGEYLWNGLEPKVYTVSSVNRYLKILIEKEDFLNNISIIGEISNLKLHHTGHIYFNLKDENSNIKCVMFKSYATNLKFKPQEGMKVIIAGSINIYERDGTYQVYCNSIFPVGIGELYQKFEMLKERLEREGIFDELHKKKLPIFPKRVGVITSRTGSVIQDIINVSTRRFYKVNLLIYPASVQGENVASTVIDGIKTFNELNNVDVIIIARGGGSFEDLFGFNDEKLAYEIYNSNIPIVSAVGHETDFTICDFVSDLRAPTPSAAAELVYPNYEDLVYRIKQYRNEFENYVKVNIYKKRKTVELLSASNLKNNLLDIINKDRMLIDSCILKTENKLHVDLERLKSKTYNLITKLDSLSPLKTLSRGYSIVQNGDNKVIKSKSEVKTGEDLNIVLCDGTISVKVN